MSTLQRDQRIALLLLEGQPKRSNEPKRSRPNTWNFVSQCKTSLNNGTTCKSRITGACYLKLFVERATPFATLPPRFLIDHPPYCKRYSVLCHLIVSRSISRVIISLSLSLSLSFSLFLSKELIPVAIEEAR